MHAWEMVSALMVLHLGQKRWYYRSINKPEVPVFLVGIGTRAQITLGSNIMYDLVLRVGDVDRQLGLV